MTKTLAVLLVTLIVAGLLLLSTVPEHCVAVVREQEAQFLFELDKWTECHLYWKFIEFKWWR